MHKLVKDLRIIFFITLITPIVYIIVFYLLYILGDITVHKNVDIFFRILVPMFGAASISTGFIYFNRKLDIIKMLDMKNSIEEYRKIFIFRLAYILFAVIFAAFAFTYTFNYVFIIYMIFSLFSYSFIYPRINSIRNEIEIDSNITTTSENKNDNLKYGDNVFKKYPWLLIPLTLIILMINFVSLEELLPRNNKNVQDVRIDKGEVKNGLYENKSIGWTYKIPHGYRVIKSNNTEQSNDTQMNQFSGMNSLKITNGISYMFCSINPKDIIPEISNKKNYFENFNEYLNSSIKDSINISTKDEGIFLIDSSKFRYKKYIINANYISKVFMHLVKIRDEKIFSITLIYASEEDGSQLLNSLKNSDLEWK